MDERRREAYRNRKKFVLEAIYLVAVYARNLWFAAINGL